MSKAYPGKASSGSPSRNNRGSQVAASHHNRRHVHLTNLIHIKHHFHMMQKQRKSMLDAKGNGELPLLRELNALQKAKALRDPSTTSARSSQSVRGSSGGRKGKASSRGASRDGGLPQSAGREPRKPGGRKGRVATPTDSPYSFPRAADEQAGVDWSGDLGEGIGPAAHDLGFKDSHHGADQGNNGYQQQRPPRPSSRSERKQRNSSATRQERPPLENWDTESWLGHDPAAEFSEEDDAGGKRERGGSRAGRDGAARDRDRRKEEDEERGGRQSRGDDSVPGTARARDNKQDFSTPPRRSLSAATPQRNDELWREEVAKKKERLLREHARRAYEQHSAVVGTGPRMGMGGGGDLPADDVSDASDDASKLGGGGAADMIELDALTPLHSEAQSPLLLRDALNSTRTGGRSTATSSRRRRSRALSMSRRYPSDGLGLHMMDYSNDEDTTRKGFGRRSLHPVGGGGGGGGGSHLEDDLEALPSSQQYLANGCGMPWNWSKMHKYKGKNIMDLAGSLTCGGSMSESSRRFSTRGISRRRSSGSYDSDQFELDSDTEALLRSGEHRRQPSAGSFDLDGDEEAKNYLHKLVGYGGGHGGHGGGSKSFLQLGSLFWNGQVAGGGGAESKHHRSLSQKYRPKSFAELVGQNLVVKALTNAVAQGKIAPVYLFQGPRGTGKTSTARIFAGVLNCLADSLATRPCGMCRECLALASRRTLDVTEVQVATNNGIDTMRELLATVLLPPTSSRFRIFIIDECHMLTKEAWNGFLKCLEEPPDRVVFMLVTTDPEALPRTAASRCQKFSFFNIKESEIVARLRTLADKESLQVDEQALGLIAAQSDGSLRDAETMLDQLSLLGKDISLPMVQELVGLVADTKLVDLLDMALSADTVSTVKCIRELLEAGAEPLALVNQLATLITNILAGSYKVAEGHRLTTFLEKHKLQEESASLRQALKVLSEAEKQLRVSNDRTTWLTAALLQFAPDRSLLFPPTSSAATSVAESNGGLAESCEKDAVEVTSAAKGQQGLWDKPGEGLRSHAVTVPAALLPAATDPRRSVPRGDGNSLSAYSPDPRGVYPGSDTTSPGNALGLRPADLKAQNVADPVPEAEPAHRHGPPPPPGGGGNLNAVPELGLKDFTTLSHRKLDDIWNRVLEGIRSLVLKELLQVQSRLLSLSLSDSGYAVAVIEFRHPDHKSKALRSRSTIAHAFHMAVGCPVEVKLSLACMPEDGEDVNPRKREQHSGPVGSNLSEQQQQQLMMAASFAALGQQQEDNMPLDKRSVLRRPPPPPLDSAYRRSQLAFQQNPPESDKVPSGTSSTWPSAGAAPSTTDTSTPRYMVHNGSEISQFQDEDQLENLWSRDHRFHQPLVHAPRSPEHLRSLKDGQELKKETVFSAGPPRKVSLGAVMNQGQQGLGPDQEYVTRLSQRKVAKHFGANGNGAIRALEQENLRLESRASNASLLCWKPSPQDEDEAKSVPRKQKKVDFFLKLVPCAKKPEQSTSEN